MHAQLVLMLMPWRQTDLHTLQPVQATLLCQQEESVRMLALSGICCSPMHLG